MSLMRRQKNELFDRVATSGLQPGDFRQNEIKSAFYIEHLPTRSSFSLVRVDGIQYHGDWNVGDYGPFQHSSSAWGETLEVFSAWVDNVKAEYQAPDMWQEFARVRNVLAATQREDGENTPFTKNEQEQISAQLTQIKELIKDRSALSEGRFTGVEEQLEHAEEASHRIGRKDWLLCFMGVLFTLVITGLLPPDVMQHILAMTLKSLAGLFGGADRQQLPPQV